MMMITPSAKISTPESDQLALWKALSDGAQAFKFFLENGKSIDKMAASITGAYALTEDERKLRDDAVDAVTNAKAELKKINDEIGAAEITLSATKKQNDAYLQKTKDAADKYKKDSLADIAAEKKKADDSFSALGIKQQEISAAQKKLDDTKKEVDDDLQKIKDWEAEKAVWEQDYEERNSKFTPKSRKAAK